MGGVVPRLVAEGLLHGGRGHAVELRVLGFLCELGRPTDAITDASGRELSDRWRKPR